MSIARTHSSIGFESTPVKSFGRPMKLDRQEVVAVYAALREWLTTNHEDRFAAYEVRIASLRGDLADIPGIEFFESPQDGPPDGLGIKIDPARVGKTAEELAEELRAGNPSIWVRHPVGPEGVVFRMPTLKPGGEKVIAQRLRELLT